MHLKLSEFNHYTRKQKDTLYHLNLAVTHLSIRPPVWIEGTDLDHSCPYWHPLHHCRYISVCLKHWLVVIHIQDLQQDKSSLIQLNKV